MRWHNRVGWWRTPWCPEWLWLLALACAEGIELGASAGLRAGAYGAGFSHCYAHCLITAICPCGLSASHVIGWATEVQQLAAARISGGASASAMQQSDFWDNALGREIGGGRFYDPRNCFQDCKARMGGAVQHPEGPGTARPFGPFHPDNPGPGPTLNELLGFMPQGWGP